MMENSQISCPRVVIAGDRGSAGKTTLLMGLAAALRQQGWQVQVFKKGPDFIDPIWHSHASGRECINLDFFMMNEQIVPSFARHSEGADICLIEGNQGLFDGIDAEGSNSTSALARRLKAPVILVIDAKKMTRGVAPLILGYQAFEPDLDIAGIILNNVAGQRHEQKLRAAIDRYCQIPVLGVVYRDSALSIDERQLGLTPFDETEQASVLIERLAEIVGSRVEPASVMAIAQKAQPLVLSADELALWQGQKAISEASQVRIAVARDSAFLFYYPENLQALRQAGAELVFFSPLHDRHLPQADALFLGGGFPEMFMRELAENQSMRNEIASAVDQGLPVYAECGGLMYLARSIDWQGQKSSMCSALPIDIQMTDRPQGRGYMLLESKGHAGLPVGLTMAAHEFHHSRVVNAAPGLEFAYRVRRGTGIDGEQDGLLYKNVLASYAHLHHYAADWWAKWLCDRARCYRASKAVIV